MCISDTPYITDTSCWNHFFCALALVLAPLAQIAADLPDAGKAMLMSLTQQAASGDCRLGVGQGGDGGGLLAPHPLNAALLPPLAAHGFEGTTTGIEPQPCAQPDSNHPNGVVNDVSMLNNGDVLGKVEGALLNPRDTPAAVEAAMQPRMPPTAAHDVQHQAMQGQPCQPGCQPSLSDATSQLGATSQQHAVTAQPGMASQPGVASQHASWGVLAGGLHQSVFGVVPLAFPAPPAPGHPPDLLSFPVGLVPPTPAAAATLLTTVTALPTAEAGTAYQPTAGSTAHWDDDIPGTLSNKQQQRRPTDVRVGEVNNSGGGGGLGAYGSDVWSLVSSTPALLLPCNERQELGRRLAQGHAALQALYEHSDVSVQHRRLSMLASAAAGGGGGGGASTSSLYGLGGSSHVGGTWGVGVGLGLGQGHPRVHAPGAWLAGGGGLGWNQQALPPQGRQQQLWSTHHQHYRVPAGPGGPLQHQIGGVSAHGHGMNASLGFDGLV